MNRPITKPGGFHLAQIEGGDYTSLMGTWVPEAVATNPYDGTGVQWRAGGPGSLSVWKDTIDLDHFAVMRGSTWSTGKGTTARSDPVQFDNNGSYLVASLANAGSVSINYSVTFYPKGALALNPNLIPNNGVTLDNSKDTILIWSSNMGSTSVFTRVD